MIYRKLDASGDYVLGAGRQGFHFELNAVTQAIYTRLRLLQEEWWEDTQDGLPLFQAILGRNGANKKAAELLIKARIEETEKVTGIASFSSVMDTVTRKYTFQAVVNTEYGQTVVRG